MASNYSLRSPEYHWHLYKIKSQRASPRREARKKKNNKKKKKKKRLTKVHRFSAVCIRFIN